MAQIVTCDMPECGQPAILLVSYVNGMTGPTTGICPDDLEGWLMMMQEQLALSGAEAPPEPDTALGSVPADDDADTDQAVIDAASERVRGFPGTTHVVRSTHGHRGELSGDDAGHSGDAVRADL